MYLFAVPSNTYGGIFGSPHAFDLAFTFGNLDTWPSYLDLTENRAEYQQVVDVVQDAWIAFVRNGSPSTAALGEWPVYNTESRQTMWLDFNSSLVSDPVSRERTIWGDIPFDGTSPSLMNNNLFGHEGSLAAYAEFFNGDLAPTPEPDPQPTSALVPFAASLSLNRRGLGYDCLAILILIGIQ